MPTQYQNTHEVWVFLVRLVLVLQNAIQRQSIDRDYVQMAVSLLQDPNTDIDLRDWATTLLSEKSPVPFQESLLLKLNSGTTLFPTTTKFFIDPNGGGLKVSEDGLLKLSQ